MTSPLCAVYVMKVGISPVSEKGVGRGRGRNASITDRNRADEQTLVFLF